MGLRSFEVLTDSLKIEGNFDFISIYLIVCVGELQGSHQIPKGILDQKLRITRDFTEGPVVKNLPASARFTGSISALGRFHTLQGNETQAPQTSPHT